MTWNPEILLISQAHRVTTKDLFSGTRALGENKLARKTGARKFGLVFTDVIFSSFFLVFFFFFFFFFLETTVAVYNSRYVYVAR